MTYAITGSYPYRSIIILKDITDIVVVDIAILAVRLIAKTFPCIDIKKTQTSTQGTHPKMIAVAWGQMHDIAASKAFAVPFYVIKDTCRNSLIPIRRFLQFKAYESVADSRHPKYIPYGIEILIICDNLRILVEVDQIICPSLVYIVNVYPVGTSDKDGIIFAFAEGKDLVA
jgi:hypothetical protein